MDIQTIRHNTQKLLAELPAGVTLVAAGKTRTPEQLGAAIDGGVQVIGHNYIQEAQRSIESLGARTQWHCIGHLQTNKTKKAAQLFDMIETVDHMKIGLSLDRSCAALKKHMPVLVEVNSAQEPAKTGVIPSALIGLVRDLARLEHIQVQGLMTMGPFSENPEDCRYAFRLTKQLFDQIVSLDLPGVALRYLSMGMSDSYLVAIEEGANMVRIGSRLFGPR